MPVIVNNTAIPNFGPAPLDVAFHGQTGFAASYMYNISIVFGDGSPNFTLAGGPGTTFFDTNHIYVASGIYPAVMSYNTDVNIINPIVTNFTITVTAPPAPVANFSGTPLSGTAPLSVAFTDLSTNGPTSWAWDFQNNGSTDSTLQNPTFIYTSAGVYTVKLTATNETGSDPEIKTNYVTVSEAPVAYGGGSFQGVNLKGLRIGKPLP